MHYDIHVVAIGATYGDAHDAYDSYEAHCAAYRAETAPERRAQHLRNALDAQGELERCRRSLARQLDYGRADRRRASLVRHVQAEARAAVSLGPAACVALAVKLAAELPEAWQ